MEHAIAPGPSVAGHEDNSLEKRDFRSADTVEVEDTALAELIWQRVRPHVTASITIDEGDDRWERGFGGTWHACGINEHLLFAKYVMKFGCTTVFYCAVFGRVGTLSS